PDRTQPGTKVGGGAAPVGGDLAHARHDAHAGHYVGAVGRLDANLAEGRIDRTHDVGNDIHGAAAHGAVKEGAHFMLGGVGVHPVVGRADIIFFRRADEREMFGAGDVIGTAAVEVAIGEGFLVEGLRVAAAEHFGNNLLVLRAGTVAKDDAAGLGQLSRFIHPAF